MSVFVISDLHLSIGEDKPMDIFGPAWGNYTTLIEQNWRSLVSEDDTVIIPGDISWAMSTEEAHTDLEFVNSLPGRKILMKGNHEYWWNTKSKLNALQRKHGLDTLYFFHNDGFYLEEGGFLMAGTRGWMVPDDKNFKKETDASIYRREAIRLEASIKKAKEDACKKGVEGAPLVVFLHYPPFSAAGGRNTFWDILDKYNVSKVYYGHLHGASCGTKKPAEMSFPTECVSADHLRFVPVKLEI